MKHHGQREVAPHPQAQGKNDPFSNQAALGWSVSGIHDGEAGSGQASAGRERRVQAGVSVLTELLVDSISDTAIRLAK